MATRVGTPTIGLRPFHSSEQAPRVKVRAMANRSVAASDERTASNSYQMSLRVGAGATDPIAVAQSQFAAWLRVQKDGWDPTLDKSGYQQQTGHDRDLLTLHHESSAGREFRARLVEATPLGDWRSQLTVRVPAEGDAWVALQVGNSQGRWTAVPRLATYLLDALPLTDGDTLMSSDTQTVGPTGIEEFLDQLCDPDRRGLFFVAGTSHGSIDFAAFRHQVSRWARQVRGLAQVAVLSPEATTQLSSALGLPHAVAPWTLRTYLPEVDPAVRGDALRHKFLTTERLAREPDQVIQQLLGRIARRHAFLRPPPDGWTQTDRTFRRLEDRTLVESIAAFVPDGSQASPGLGENRAGSELEPTSAVTEVTPTPPRTPREQAPDVEASAPREPLPAELELTAALLELAQLKSKLDHVTSALGLAGLDGESISQLAAKTAQADAVAQRVKQIELQLADRGEQIAELEDRLSLLNLAYEESQIDERVAASDASKLEDENRWLRSRLEAAGDYDGAFAVVPEEAYRTTPENWAELLDRLPELENAGVVFTGDENELLALDSVDTVGKIASVAWQALLALADYVRARNDGKCGTNVRQYLRETPNGYQSMPKKKYAEGETSVTMQQWGDLRDFPVPVTVDPSGSARMEAHFKLGHLGMVSPRMYYLDDYSGSGRVYVGYIGAHLKNTMTN
ncbi:hypothetical protein [Nocardioides mangrovi]|uniref:Uncharacterized protein n=1 Tax=Nocardioides mangrovi TaxID=2874580 RepID=A0ABS7UG92_9ACTN|nr:hypothetical protein [Nocardioides mangrovi]MBZ5739845.1 hypothetical protein [Nocardioides mangrovi]